MGMTMNERGASSIKYPATREPKLTMDKHPVWTIAFGIIWAQVICAVICILALLALGYTLSASSHKSGHTTTELCSDSIYSDQPSCN